MPRGIPNARATEVAERRRKPTGESGRGLKLWVPEDWLDRKKFNYRWADDKDNRLSQLTMNDDYDFVNVPGKDGEEGRISRTVGMHEGKPLKSYLLAKPRKYYVADQKEKEARIKATVDEIRRGGTKHLADLGGETSSDSASLYTPGGRDGQSGVNIIGGS